MSNLVMSFLAILACVCFYLLKDGKKEQREIIWTVYSVVLGIAIYLFLAKFIYRVSHPEIWDYTAFHLYGKVAVGGYDFYQPENFKLVINSLQLPFTHFGEFGEEVLDVGFPYPPPTMLYFAPLGYLSYHTGLVVWAVFTTLFLFASIYLVYDLFFKKYKLNGIFLVTILFFLLSPVRTTIFHTQTNFILLFLLLLMKKHAKSKYAGIFLALAVFTKPYMVVFLAFFVVMKKWDTIVWFVLSVVALVGITVAIFGIVPFQSYIFDNFVSRLPHWSFSEQTNQSLHAVLLRSRIISVDQPFVYTYIVLGILMVTGGFLLFLIKKKLYDHIWAILLLVGLIVYPGTLSNYGTLLLFIIFQLFEPKKQLGINFILCLVIIGLIYGISPFSVFACMCLLLSVVVIKSLNSPPQLVPVTKVP